MSLLIGDWVVLDVRAALDASPSVEDQIAMLAIAESVVAFVAVAHSEPKKSEGVFAEAAGNSYFSGDLLLVVVLVVEWPVVRFLPHPYNPPFITLRGEVRMYSDPMALRMLIKLS